jgi:hypothetical protein
LAPKEAMAEQLTPCYCLMPWKKTKNPLTFDEESRRSQLKVFVKRLA